VARAVKVRDNALIIKRRIKQADVLNRQLADTAIVGADPR